MSCNHSVVTPLFSMRTGSLVSSQTCRSVDADAWCKRALTNLYAVCRSEPVYRAMNIMDVKHYGRATQKKTNVCKENTPSNPRPQLWSHYLNKG